MTNLLKQTIKFLKDNKRTPEDILWCGNSDVWFTWEDFKRIADFDFEPSGKPVIAEDLQIIGRDFIMNRCYNETEEDWWFMEVLPLKPANKIKPTTLIGQIK